jgi:hypothetical protein
VATCPTTFGLALPLLIFSASPALNQRGPGMANTLASPTMGAQAIQTREGASPTMGLTVATILSTDSTQIFNGDLVQTNVSSGMITSDPMPRGGYITAACSGLTTVAAYRGIFRGCQYYNSAIGRVVWSNYWPGGGAAGVSSAIDATCWLETYEGSVWSIQCSSGSGIVGSSMVGQNFPVLTTASTSGNTTSGFSNMTLASSQGSSNSSCPFRLRDFYSNYVPPGGFVNGSDNTTVYQIVVVEANNFETKNTTGQ